MESRYILIFFILIYDVIIFGFMFLFFDRDRIKVVGSGVVEGIRKN